MDFTDGAARLTNYKASSKGDDDEMTEAIHLAFSCVAPGAVLTTLMGCDEVPLLWSDDEDKRPLHNGVAHIKLFTTAQADKLNFGRVRIKQADLKSFQYRPVAGGNIELTFAASIYEPKDDHATLLRHMLKRKAKLAVRTEPDLFIEEPDPDPEEEQPDLDLPM